MLGANRCGHWAQGTWTLNPNVIKIPDWWGNTRMPFNQRHTIHITHDHKYIYIFLLFDINVEKPWPWPSDDLDLWASFNGL